MDPLWKLTYHYPDETLERTIYVNAKTIEKARAKAKKLISENIIIIKGDIFN